MVDTFRSPAQAYPAAGVLTNLYTVPGVTQVSGSTIVACNQGSQQAKIRVSLAVAGAADDPKQYIVFDMSVPGNDSYMATVGITLAATDVVRVQSDTGQVSFNFFPLEFS